MINGVNDVVETWPTIKQDHLRIRIKNKAAVALTDDVTVRFAFVPLGEILQREPVENEWFDAEWEGTAALTRVAWLLVGPEGDYIPADGDYIRWYNVASGDRDIREPVPGILRFT